MNFGPVTHIQTESNAYEPTVHTHRWAQKCTNPIKIQIRWIWEKWLNPDLDLPAIVSGINEHKTFWVYVWTCTLESLTMWRATIWLIITYIEKPEGLFYL